MGDAEKVEVPITDKEEEEEGEALEVVDVVEEQPVQEEEEETEEKVKPEPNPVDLMSAPRKRPPTWAMVPKGLKFPRGSTPMFIRFRAELTATPHKGERQAIILPLTVSEQLVAVERAKVHESETRVLFELAKQMIRSVDGHIADWTGKPGPANIDTWWKEIGPKYRGILQDLFNQLHVLKPAELKDFFENCIVPVSTG